MSFELLEECMESHSVSRIAKKLNIVPGTVNRWILLKDVPSNYEFDLLKILGRNIDYSQYTHKLKDQFFTPQGMANRCIDTFLQVTGVNPDEYTFIEPSAGDGSFFNALSHKKIGIDIEPRCDGVSKSDFLDWTPPDTSLKYVVIGNPPFGLRGHMALNFINHSHAFADYVAFILPQLFESDGRGSPRKRVQGYNLIHSEKLSGMFHMPNGNETKINGVFQVWSKYTNNDEFEIRKIDNEDVCVYSISDGGTVSSRRNVKMIGKCHVYLPSTCFGENNMKTYDIFDELPGKKGYGIFFKNNVDYLIKKAKQIEWSKESFKSTNSALNLRASIIHQFLQ
jgi:hypothetical protein